ncbi:hypothetical protein H072_7761 [Dactylellina haptotyla CBS 200.50]|uniref:Uncharacterized protein n=1 Tax=Dactylellina haptotyla (strain CBS 200.50) TaxID=1284197 RepID=S8BGP6_DACHA|nr:hypothetical protein H072_7761 [Dactylellina haptotyla CBS 200.50]
MSAPQPPPLAPSQVFVCRHGARLDASDSTWHLTSPTPYDPPLTYGGWTQARSLGNRIASLIVSQISSEHPSANPPAPKPVERTSTWTAGPKEAKKYVPAPVVPSVSSPAASKLKNTKIIIHTSPFLRCVQTSIAVTAGMSQYFSDINLNSMEPTGATGKTGVSSGEVTSKLVHHPRPMLRVDGFLSEWLCEDYFAEITPPPATSLMVGTAKIDLMRPSSAGGLRKDGAPMSIASNNTPTTGQTHLPTLHHHSHNRAHSVGFVPPVATSAIGKNEPIPRGHVSHAKDFLDIDYAYDSLRYGDGGEYGEEWGRMHKRVKIGFEKIIKDYADGEVKPCLKNSPHTSFDQLSAASQKCEAPESPNEISGGTIVIFISHGAICNALIGAMTHKPVLMDMGIASMSMGVLIPSSATTPLPSPLPQSPITSLTTAFQLPSFGGVTQSAPPDEDNEDPFSFPSDKPKQFTPYIPPVIADSAPAVSGVPSYDVKIVASTDHLRSQTAQSKSQNQGSNSGTSAQHTPPLRPRKQSVGGGFSMYNTAGKLPAPLIGSASGSSNANPTGGAGLFTGGRAMASVFGSGGGGGGGGMLSPLGSGSGPAMGVRRTASAAAATKGLWSLPATEMERGSSDEGALLTDEESGEEKKDKSDGKGETRGMGQRKGSTASSSGSGAGAGVTRSGSTSLKPGLWNAGANAERRRRWTVTNQNDEGGA